MPMIGYREPATVAISQHPDGSGMALVSSPAGIIEVEFRARCPSLVFAKKIDVQTKASLTEAVCGGRTGKVAIGDSDRLKNLLRADRSSEAAREAARSGPELRNLPGSRQIRP